MTDLVVRKVPWEFDGTVPFMWQPANPNFGLFCNVFTFIVVPFERYIVSVVRKAGDRLTEDEELASETEAFLRQEAQHAAAHRKHMMSLVRCYPELERCYDDACKAYDDLIDEQPIEFHVAYIANLEVVSQPLYRVVLDNPDSLFDGGDRRVASLIMWHFVEEIEHRSSGLKLCRHINADHPWYRVKHARRTLSHFGKLSEAVAKTFDRVIPFEDRGASAQRAMSNSLFSEFIYRLPGVRHRRGRRAGTPWVFHVVPTRQLVKMVWRTVLSLTPNYDPDGQPLPEWAETWMREYERGTKMTTFFGTVPERVTATKG